MNEKNIDIVDMSDDDSEHFESFHLGTLTEEQKKHCLCESNCNFSVDTTKRDEELKTSLLRRLNKIEGQIRGIKQMIERDEYCDNVLTQISASSSALNSVSKLVLENHLRKCFVEKIRSGDDKIIDDVIKIIGKIL